MNRFIKQLSTPNSPIVQLAEHKTENLKRTCRSGFESKGFRQIFVLIFTKLIDVTTF